MNNTGPAKRNRYCNAFVNQETSPNKYVLRSFAQGSKGDDRQIERLVIFDQRASMATRFWAVAV
jgi:hypothetical protein